MRCFVLFFFLVFALHTHTPLFLPPGYCTLKCDVSCIECSESRYFIVRKCLVFSKPSRQTPHWITGDSFKRMPAIHSHENTNSCIKSGRTSDLSIMCRKTLHLFYKSFNSSPQIGVQGTLRKVQSCF